MFAKVEIRGGPLDYWWGLHDFQLLDIFFRFPIDTSINIIHFCLTYFLSSISSIFLMKYFILARYVSSATVTCLIYIFLKLCSACSVFFFLGGEIPTALSTILCSTQAREGFHWTGCLTKVEYQKFLTELTLRSCHVCRWSCIFWGISS